jgi:hypothetical protein
MIMRMEQAKLVGNCLQVQLEIEALLQVSGHHILAVQAVMCAVNADAGQPDSYSPLERVLPVGRRTYSVRNTQRFMGGSPSRLT